MLLRCCAGLRHAALHGRQAGPARNAGGEAAAESLPRRSLQRLSLGRLRSHGIA